MTASLYRFFDEHGSLLYVGITESPFRRLDGHASTQPWWHLVRTATYEHFATRDQARDAEVAAIQSEHPAFNVEGNGDPRLSERLESWKAKMQRRALAEYGRIYDGENFAGPPYDVPCDLPLCGALEFEPCRTSRGNRKPEAHGVREKDSWKARHCKTCGAPPSS